MNKKLEELDYYNMTAEEKIRWHILHDCTCGFLESDEFYIPSGHYQHCPMNNPNDDSWNYLYYYDCLPQ